MSIQAYQNLVSEYKTDIQNLRVFFYNQCLEKAQVAGISNIKEEEIQRVAYKFGEIFYKLFAEAVRNKYSGNDKQNLIELLIGSEEPIFTGCGPYFLPKKIINIWRDSTSRPREVIQNRTPL